MNFKQLEAFIWVAELQSFTRAARQLFMSQPAVSFQIKALEEDLQVALFQRGDKKVMLTEAGRLLYPEAKQMIRHYNRIKAGLDDLKGLKTGHLVVGASTIPGEYLLPLMIGGFKEKFPGIQVILKVAGSGQVSRWIREREIDLGITGTTMEGEGIECQPWLLDHLILIVNPSHPWSKQSEVTLNDLKDESMILREQGSGTRRSLEQRLAEKGVILDKIPHTMELGSTRAVITAVEANLGVSIVSKYAVKEALELGRVKEVKLSGVDLSRYLYQIRHTQGIGGYAIEAFITFVNDAENRQLYLKV
ncbi:selenium metabolism-associated LysR family transcriptional regulator [Pelotomaculum propionicicum]|uniref:HTH-type transcriptional activator CmpR n=1 Tax=Pelotomaculum propionicicum TaxID=258475 RepID=A0A4Y7RU84_9FIRM|nr:selenium metabolism-associated LysR family transcriptional regulator [Pelotomaculum propionicicum]NLI13742.1 LysR family transcriptional regulator [Peptococcaceae bacterium]TEB12535.1 HTH-type transcriptional activator CmpR [Pelotomaculum propionicicum]